MVSAAEKRKRDALAARLSGATDDDSLGNPADFEAGENQGSDKPEAETIVPEVDPGSGSGDVGEAAVLENPEGDRPTQESATDSPVHVAQESATDQPIRIAQESATDLTGTGIGETTVEDYIAPAEENARNIAEGNYSTDEWGNKYDEHGNMIDDDGNVMKTREEVMAAIGEALGRRNVQSNVQPHVIEEGDDLGKPVDRTVKARDEYAREMLNTTPINPPQPGASSFSRREAEMARGREAIQGRHTEVQRGAEMDRGARGE